MTAARFDRAGLRATRLLAAAAVVVGCADVRNPDPSITAVEPAVVTSRATTPATIRGASLFNRLRVELGGDEPPAIDARWQVLLGDARTDVGGVVRVDDATLTIVVPAGLAVGEHDVTVVLPGGGEAPLRRGLAVTDEPVGLQLTVEDAPGGLGGPAAATLAAGQTLEVYAVVRDQAGGFVIDVDAAWEVVGAIGELGPGPSAAASFTARRAGVGRIRARRVAAGLIGESGDLAVTPGPPAALVIVDPQTAEPIDDRLGLTTDPDGALAAAAVAVDAYGNVVGAWPATWSLGGVAASLPGSPVAAVVVDFASPGVGVLTASDPQLGQDSTGSLQVAPGRVAALTVAPATLTLRADDAPVAFTASGRDADDNPTPNLGTVTWAVASGPITAIDPITGLLDPAAAGTGTIRASSSHGPTAVTGPIVVEPGRAAALTVAPGGLAITADAAPVAFTASASDADGNPTADLGAVTWSIGSGPISAVHPVTGVLDPVGAGTGTVRAVSSHGPSAVAAVTIAPGRAASVTVQPDTLVVSADAAPVPFTVAASDADGNPTADVGTLSWSIATGPITLIDPGTGVFDPRTAGVGTVRVTSSFGPSATSGDVVVQPGTVASLSIAPATLVVSADASPVAFSATARDADGNPTAAYGVLGWSIASGPISQLAPTTGLFTPTAAGAGTIRVTSSLGPTAVTGAITVVPGRAAALEVVPATLAVSADAAPVPFATTAVDADGNATSDVGTVTWSIASGPITSIHAGTGVFDPVTAGVGTVRATSSYGPSAVSGSISVSPGALAALTVAPATATLRLGGAAQQFTATGSDADGNTTAATGALTWSIASGPIEGIDPGTGLFTPVGAGTGAVRVTSSLGPSGDSGSVRVSVGISIVSIDVPPEVARGQRGARVEAVVENTEPTPVPITGGYLSFARSGVDVASSYVVRPDFRNPGEVPGASTAVLAFDVDVVAAPAFGVVDVTAHVQGVVPGWGVQSDARTAAWTVLDVAPPVARITSPGPVRICAGSAVGFNGTTSTGAPPLTFLWDLAGASPSFSTAAAPGGIGYPSAGAFPYALTVTGALGRQDTAFGTTPVYVGALGADAYATGAIGFDKPVVGQLENMASLPNANFIDNGGGFELKRCDGSSIPNGPNKYVTVWVDRGVIPLAMDSYPSLPGIQIALSSTGLIKSVDLDNAAVRREGPAIAYAEYRRADGAVTASGWVTFAMTNDTQAPAVAESVPATSCGASICRGKVDGVLVRFSEPIQPATLSTAIVEAGPAGSVCSDATAFSDISAGSTITYDAAAMTARVAPQVLAPTSYKVRLRLGTGVRDQSSNSNGLPTYALCVNVGTTAPPAAPATPTGVGASPATFSPDGDGTQDTVAIQASVDAAATSVRVTISRDPSTVIALVRGVSAPGVTTIAWDGRDLSGRMVPNGHYLYTVTAVNAAGVASPAVEGVVTVDSAISFVGVPPRY